MSRMALICSSMVPMLLSISEISALSSLPSHWTGHSGTFGSNPEFLIAASKVAILPSISLARAVLVLADSNPSDPEKGW